MPQNPLSGRALSALTVVPDLQPTDRFALLRPTAADPLDQNVTLTSDRLQFALLATLTPVVLTALAGLLAAKADLDAASGFVVPAQLPPVTFASTTGNPLDNALLRALLLANGSASITSTYAQAQAAAAATPATLQVGKFYLITARPNDATTNILVQANTSSTFAGSEAYSQAVSPAGAPYLPVTYVFAADTVTARVVVLPTTAPLTTNALRGGPKLVDYLTPFAAMAPYQVALSQMPLSGLAIGTRAFVQNPTPAPASGAIVPAAYYVLARCASTDPLAVSAFVNGGGGAVTLQTPAKWVAENSAEGQAAFFALFDPAGRTGTNDYPIDYVVKYVENGRLGTYEATQQLTRSVFISQGLTGIPAPGGTTNAYWRPYAPAVAGQTPYLSLTLAAARSLAADPDTIQGIMYHVLRGAAGDVLLQGIPSRAAAAAGDPTAPGGFSPVGIWCDPAATVATAYKFVDYNVAADTVTLRISTADLAAEIAARTAADATKVDKVAGSSLLANTEITRLLTLLGFTVITLNQYGIHPALATQAGTNAYLLGRVTANVAPTIGTPSLSSTSITVGASVTATASAADSDGTVASVEYFLDGASRGSSAVGPSYPVTFTPAVTGSRLITAQATDNLGAKSVISAAATLMVNGANTAPGQVVNVAASPATATSVYVSYSQPANGGSAITDYLFEYSSNGGTTYTAFAHTAITGTAVTITGLTASTAYLVRVSAINAVGTGTASATATATTPAPAAAQTITATSATPS